MHFRLLAYKTSATILYSPTEQTSSYTSRNRIQFAYLFFARLFLRDDRIHIHMDIRTDSRTFSDRTRTVSYEIAASDFNCINLISRDITPRNGYRVDKLHFSSTPLPTLAPSGKINRHAARLLGKLVVEREEKRNVQGTVK